jgi:hypothetical protein
MRGIDLLALLLGVIFPLASGYVTKWIMNFLKDVSTLVDRLPVAAKRIVVTLIASLITFVFGFFGINITDALFSDLNAPQIQALLGAAFAMIFHDGEKVKKVAEVTGVDVPLGSTTRYNETRTL